MPKIGFKYRYVLLAILALFIVFYFSLPKPLIDKPHSYAVYAGNGQLLGARVSEDEQWRFEPVDTVPDKLRTAILEFEDRYFYYHPGVNAFSIIRAAWSNIRELKVVSGASTITMQLVRISRDGKPRNIWQKAIEMWLSLRVECSYSKDQILALYCSYAPYGGNVVGLEAASLRYFGTSYHVLSWAEAATLAVLPNAPSLMHPGKNRQLLKNKRDKLLKRLLEKDVFDTLTYQLSIQESIPRLPFSLPDKVPELLTLLENEHPNGITVHSTIDYSLQTKSIHIINKHYNFLRHNKIHNLAALVADVQTGHILAYVGNVQLAGKDNQNMVDMIRAQRSTGSILKPYLYALMIDKGELLPNQLVPDIPTHIGDFAPKNFDLKYYGAVPAQRALARSLNIPAVRMLQEYGVSRFYHDLQDMGMTSLNFPPDHYGLTLILGGAEARLMDLCAIYASMGRTLNHFNSEGGYISNGFHSLSFTTAKKTKAHSDNSKLSAGAIWNTFEAMREVNRPMQEQGWQKFYSSQPIAWKTGTSFGFRDAWAIGVTPGYVVGVWAGNADGEGRPGLTGVTAAAPVLRP